MRIAPVTAPNRARRAAAAALLGSIVTDPAATATFAAEYAKDAAVTDPADVAAEHATLSNGL